MATIAEILARIEEQDAKQSEAINNALNAILAYNVASFNCLRDKINELASQVSCPSVADIVVAADRSRLIVESPGSPGNDVFVRDWLISFFTEISIGQSGVNGSIYTSPKENSGPNTLSNTVENHSLTGSGTALKIAAQNYTVESVGDGRRPYDQLLNAASTQLIANGRVGSRKIIVLLITGRSNFLTGYGSVATDPVLAATNARSQGYEVYVVSVSGEVNPGEAASIAGHADNLFHADDYDELIYTIDDLRDRICSSSSSFVDCQPDEPDIESIEGMDICNTKSCCDEILSLPKYEVITGPCCDEL